MQKSDDHLVGRLPDNIIDAIQHGRKIEAIKQVREHYRIGLKDARQVIEDYISENGGAESELPDTGGITLERIIFLLIMAAVLYGLYEYLMK